MYSLIRPILFLQDPEKVHHRTIKLFRKLEPLTPIIEKMYSYQHPRLNQTVDGIQHRNPVGLAAGFDKNAHLPNVIHSIGFGHAEIGSTTAQKCDGNQKPRLWRWKKYKSLIVNYGLANDGADTIAKRLANATPKIPIGISIAKTNTTMTLKEALQDWAYSFNKLHQLADYTTINISCPNICQDQQFDTVNLRKLLTTIQKQKPTKPVYLKISPHTEIDELYKTIKSHSYVKGLIVGNLNKKIRHPRHTGGLSGQLVKKEALQKLTQAAQNNKKYTLIGCGGITNSYDAYEHITRGASLIQLMTSMIYQGPATIKHINQGLVKLLKKNGHKNIKDAIGSKIH